MSDYFTSETEIQALRRELIELTSVNESMRATIVAALRRPLRRMSFLQAGPARDEHAIPGLLEQFKTVVPASHIRLPARGPGWVDVSCVCGELVALAPASIDGCGCGRFFVNTGLNVRVARPDPEETPCAPSD